MTWTKRLLVIGLVAFGAALGGTYIGRELLASTGENETELHALLHSELDLDAQQAAKIELIERRFSTRRKALELEMRAANAHLAEAMEAEHGYGPEVSAAVDHTHRVMGELQKETLEHLFAMRAVLTPDQAARFDRTVTKALTPEVQ
ncbi:MULTISPECIES: periplasmic heavy metal sensor [Erythrobacter]|jgi:Spy/CpxP family protein refolding chaperone|uniref:periplasmic heavy metal sensor n=1 Tax=Erythrobacter TaxID=1041 RepID=UPI00082E36A1|nr:MULTISPECIES: periplasmic heavy metal sensor [Erythrobacter]